MRLALGIPVVGKKDKHLAAAQKLLERGQLEKALAELGKVVEDDPKDTRVWLKMAEIQAKRGAHEEAAAIYLKTGDLYIEQGFAQKAVAVYKNVVKLTPSAVEAYVKLGSLYKQLGLMNDSAQQYEAAATLYQRSGKLKEAVNAFRLVVEVQPESLAAHIKLAELAAQAGAADEAGRSFGKAADLLKTQGRIDEYLRVLERLLHHQPDNFARSREAADVYVSRGNPRAAIARLLACLKVDPRDPGTLSLLALCYEQLENKPKAVSVLKELVRVCHETGQNSERDAALKRALALAPGDADLTELAGLYRVRTGVGPSPLRRGLSGPSLVSPFPKTSPGLGLSLNLPGATSIPPPGGSGQTVAAPARDAARLYAETEVFAKYGLLERAEQHARKLLALHPEHAEGRALLAQILEEGGRSDEAAAERRGVSAPSAVRSADADDGIPLALDVAAPLRPLRAESFDLEGAEELDSADLEEMTAELEEMSTEEEMLATPGPVLAEEDDPAALQLTPPPVDVAAFGDLGLPEKTEAVIPLPAPVRRGALASDDESGRFDAGPSLGRAARMSLDAVEATPPPTPPPVLPSPVLSSPSAPRRASSSLAPASLLTPPPLADVDSELAQVDFYLAQDMVGEAEELVQRLTTRHAEDPRVRERLAELEARANGRNRRASRGFSSVGAVPQTPQAVRRSGPIGAPMTPPPGVGLPPVPNVKLSPAELEGHADLGVAYKEMGLYEQAIVEFRALESAPSRAVFAMTMTGECLEKLGRLSEAAALYKRALNTEGVKDAETVVLYHGLGRTFEGLGDLTEARYFYEKVLRRDPSFKDAAARLSMLQGSLRRPEKHVK